MSYPDIPRYATSYNCSRAQYLKVWRFENKERTRAHGRNWHRLNPAWNAIRNANGYGYDDERLNLCHCEQKSPLDLLIEKEEAGL